MPARKAALSVFFTRSLCSTLRYPAAVFACSKIALGSGSERTLTLTGPKTEARSLLQLHSTPVQRNKVLQSGQWSLPADYRIGAKHGKNQREMRRKREAKERQHTLWCMLSSVCVVLSFLCFVPAFHFFFFFTDTAGPFQAHAGVKTKKYIGRNSTYNSTIHQCCLK